MYDFKKEVAQRLKELLKSKNLSQIQFANETGLSKDTVSKLLRRKIVLSIQNALQISEVFGVSLDYLYGKIDVETQNQYALEILLNHFKFSSGTINFPNPITEAYLSVSPAMADFLNAFSRVEKAQPPDDIRADWEKREKDKFLGLIATETEDSEQLVLINKNYYTDTVAAAVKKVMDG